MAVVRQPVFLYITVWGHLAIVLGAFSFYHFEHKVNPGINTFLDTFYWTIATVTTVGYGSYGPVTTGGKLVGIVMMIAGSIFLWTYTALLTKGLVTPEIRRVEVEVEELEENVGEVGRQVTIDAVTAKQLLEVLQKLSKERA